MSGLTKSKGLAFDSGGPSDYSELDNKPSINGVELDGDKSTEQLKIGIKTVTYVASDVSELPAVSAAGATALVISANRIGLFYIANSLTGYNWELNTDANSKQYVGKVILCTDTQEFYVCLSYSYGAGYTWIKGGGSLFDIKIMSQLLAENGFLKEKGWALLCKSTRQDLAKADVPTLYQDIKDKYDNADDSFITATDTSVGKVLYDDTDGRTYWFTWDSLNYSESMDMSNPHTLTLSEVNYYRYVLLGNNINLVFDEAEYMKTTVRVYDKSWNYIKSFNIDGRYFVKYQKTDNGLVAVAYDRDESLLQVLRVEDDVQADYSITPNIYGTYGLTPINIANKIYDNKIYITGRTKENIGLGAIFTLEIDINDFTSIHLYQSDDLGGGYTSAISNLLKYNNTWYIVYQTYVYSSSNLINWTQGQNLSDGCYCAYNYNNSNYYFVLSDKIVTTTDFSTYTDVTTYSANVSGFYFFFANTSTFFLSYISNGIVYGGTVKTVYTDTYSINGNTVEIDYYTKDGFKICLADGTNDTNLASVYDYMGYYNYYRLDITNETVSLPRNSNLYAMMYVGDNYQDTIDGITGNPTRLLPQAEIIEDDSTSVSLAVKGNKNYQLSASALTSLTISSCEDSQLRTTIRFTSGATPTTITDSASIDWVDGATPIPSASKKCLIFIWNKIGFYKEW